MIKVTVSNNTKRATVIVSEDETVKKILQDNDIALGVGTVSLDGIPLHAEDMGKTLKQLNVTENCFIVSVVKSDNA